jgi:glycosyltransferase involved in cell wall biosynthesis
LATYQGIVVPSLGQEGLPTIVLEAMSAGTPAIMSSNIASGRDLERRGVVRTFAISDGRRGLEEASAWVDDSGSALRRLCTDVWAQNYSEESWVARILPLYERIAEAAPPR